MRSSDFSFEGFAKDIGFSKMFGGGGGSCDGNAVVQALFLGVCTLHLQSSYRHNPQPDSRQGPQLFGEVGTDSGSQELCTCSCADVNACIIKPC